MILTTILSIFAWSEFVNWIILPNLTLPNIPIIWSLYLLIGGRLSITFIAAVRVVIIAPIIPTEASLFMFLSLFCAVWYSVFFQQTEATGYYRSDNHNIHPFGWFQVHSSGCSYIMFLLVHRKIWALPNTLFSCAYQVSFPFSVMPRNLTSLKTTWFFRQIEKDFLVYPFLYIWKR